MFCIFCKQSTEVVNSRSSKKTAAVWRRRTCRNCHTTFSTREKPDLALSIKVEKRDGHIEPFSEDKLFLSIAGALSHKKSAHVAARALSETILGKLLPFDEKLVDSKDIAWLAYPVIRRYDAASGTYYKAHHIDG